MERGCWVPSLWVRVCSIRSIRGWLLSLVMDFGVASTAVFNSLLSILLLLISILVISTLFKTISDHDH